MINQLVDLGLQADIHYLDCDKSLHSCNEAHVGFTAGFASFIPQGKKVFFWCFMYFAVRRVSYFCMQVQGHQ